MKVLLFFHIGSKNRGCEAIVRSAVQSIKEQMPNAEVNLCSFDPQSDTIIPLLDHVYDGKDTELNKFSIPWFVSALKVKFFKDESYAFRYRHQNIIKLIPQHDLILSIGGDNYCYGEQPWLYEVDRCVKAAGKKLILWGASIGEEDLSKNKINDLKTFDLLLVRESITYQNLVDKGIQNVKLIADGAFLMEKEELPFPDGWQEGNTIGFNYSPLVWKRNAASQQAAFKLLQHIIDTTDFTIALTPHVIIQNNDDYLVLEQFYDKFKATGRVLLLPNNLNAIQYKGFIARMRLFIGARTHATIAAYSNCVPTLVLGYSIKSKGIAKDIFGTERLVLGIKDISDEQKLIKGFEELKRDENEIRAILQNKIPEIRKRASKAAIYLKELTK